MQLNSLKPQTKKKRPEPVGRGGRRGKTSGRGSKGQTSRAGHKIRPEIRDMIKKLPKRRGHGKNRARTVRTNIIPVSVVNLSDIESTFNTGDIVSPVTLLAKGLVRRAKGRTPFVKILGSGTVTKKFVVKGCTISSSALKSLKSAGGTYND